MGGSTDTGETTGSMAGAMAGAMTGPDADIAALRALNAAINDAENAGDSAALAGMVADHLAFRRRDGTIVDRSRWLSAPRPGRRVLRIESITVYGQRAVVACVVGEGEVHTHNLRLFVRDAVGWRLLGWANEPVPG